MIPKKPALIVKQVAEDMDIPISTVDDIISFYYKEVRKTLSSLEHLRIDLPGLGNFVIKKKSVDRLAKKYRILMEKYDNQTFSNYHNKKSAESKLERLGKATVKIQEFLNEKKEFRDGKQTKRDLEA
jgi:nucleoid DNA-binding protein